MLLGLLGVVCAQLAPVKATNFGGMDEWLILNMTSRGIVDLPYANRPLELLWDLPAPALAPYRLDAFRILHGCYLFGCGAVVIVLCGRLLAGRPLLAFMAGVFTAGWAPMDSLRLNVLSTVAYSGMTLATLFALLLFFESWRRESLAGLGVGALLAVITPRSYESALPLLASGPVWLSTWTPRSRRRDVWMACWTAAIMAAGLMVLVPFLLSRSGSYQESSLGLDLDPLRVLGRLARQYGYHLLPLFVSPVRDLASPAVACATAAFAAAFAALARRPDAPEELRPTGLVRLMAGGLILAGLGYSAFTLTPKVHVADRTQFLSAPGIALFLAATLTLLSCLVPRALRAVVLAALGATVVAVGTGRTLALQREWDESRSLFGGQRATLVQLTREVPDVKPNTLFVLLDEARAWPATFAFRHAVAYLYQGRALGYVWGASDFLYPAHFNSTGIASIPWGVIQVPWKARPTYHRYDEVIVLRFRRDWRLEVLQEWPAGTFPNGPATREYRPSTRVLRPASLPPERAVLGAG